LAQALSVRTMIPRPKSTSKKMTNGLFSLDEIILFVVFVVAIVMVVALAPQNRQYDSMESRKPQQ